MAKVIGIIPKSLHIGKFLGKYQENSQGLVQKAFGLLILSQLARGGGTERCYILNIE